jgi:L-prolyl-PCP dehydrogenase
MDFTFCQTQCDLIARVREFARRELQTPMGERDRDETFGADEWKACGAEGLLGLPVPREYGGLGQDCVTTARILEALGELATDRGLLFAASAHMFACVVPIWRYAVEAHKREWLPRLCSGEWMGANAATEAEAGSDIFAIRTTARRDGDSYVLDGQKSFVSNAPRADVFVVYATTDKTLGALGTTGFVVPRSTPGLTIGPAFATIGLRTAPMGTIALDNCRIPASHRLGREGDGKAAFEASMTWERLCLFGIWVGFMQAQLDRAIGYAKSRRQFGKPIGKNQAVSHRIADMKLRLESARWLLYRACWLLDRDQATAVDCSLAKLAVSEAAVQSALDLVQIHGATGVMADPGVERGLRDVIPGTIYSGTSEMHREIVARHLGL